MENILAQEETFRSIVSDYSAESASAFGDKKNKAAMLRARKQLLLLRKQCNVLRVAIQEYKKSL